MSDQLISAHQQVEQLRESLKPFSLDNGDCLAHPATLHAFHEAKTALAYDDMHRFAHLREVTRRMIARDLRAFNRDPAAWRTRMQARWDLIEQEGEQRERADLVGVEPYWWEKDGAHD
jgi:hypothetical protein